MATSTRQARREASRSNHPSTWQISVRENGPSVQGSKHRAGTVHLRAFDGGRVLNVDIDPAEVKAFDPERHWQLIVGQSTKVKVRK